MNISSTDPNVCKRNLIQLVPLLLKWINLNHNMDMKSYTR